MIIFGTRKDLFNNERAHRESVFFEFAPQDGRFFFRKPYFAVIFGLINTITRLAREKE